MNVIKINKINDEIVKPVRFQTGANTDLREFKGRALFSEGYFNCFCLVKKKSGKTTVLNKIVRGVCTTETTVLDICSTADKDKMHLSIKAYCKSKNITYVSYTSMKEDGIDVIDVLLKKLELDAKHEQESDSESDEEDEQKGLRTILFNSSSEAEEDVKPRKCKFRSPKYLIILDDLSNELKSPTIATLLKKHRHFDISVVASSQYCNDLHPQSLKQLDVCMIFAGEPVEKLQKLHKDFDLALNFDLFLKLYYNATKDKYNFLYVDIRNEKFRKNFSHEYQIPEKLL